MIMMHNISLSLPDAVVVRQVLGAPELVRVTIVVFNLHRVVRQHQNSTLLHCQDLSKHSTVARSRKQT